MLYFDYAATSPTDPRVLETFVQVSQQYFANPSSVHPAGATAAKLLQQARNQVADILHVDKKEIYFTSSGTESNNWALQSLTKCQSRHRPEANRVLLLSIEHPSILKQVDWLQAQGFEVHLLAVDQEGRIDLEALKNSLDDRVCLLSTMAVNNEVGSIQPIDAIAKILKDYPQVVWHVDGVQAAAYHLDLLMHPRIDALSLSAHKFSGMRGCGILMCRQRVHLSPLLFGGGQEAGLRSSTENLAAIVASAKALRLSQENISQKRNDLKIMRQTITQALENAGWTLFAHDAAAHHIICCALAPLPGEVLVHAFGQEGVMVSTTSACSSRKQADHHTLKAMGIPDKLSKSAIRISLGADITPSQVQGLVTAIQNITQKFKRDSVNS